MAELLIADRVRHVTRTTGTGAITLEEVPLGWRSFAAAGLIDGDTFPYSIDDPTSRDWETGTGTLTGGTVARTPHDSSLGGVALDLQPGTKNVTLGVTADHSAVVTPNGPVVDRWGSPLFPSAPGDLARRGVYRTAGNKSVLVQSIIDELYQEALYRDPFPAENGLNALPDCDYGYVDGNVTKNGLYHLDGNLMVAGKRCVMDDGIYVTSAGAWAKLAGPNALDYVTIRNGTVNEGRRVFWSPFGGGWSSWPMEGAIQDLTVSQHTSLDAPLVIRPGVRVKGNGSFVRNFGGSYSTFALRFITQSENERVLLRSRDGGSGVAFYQWGGGYYARGGWVVARDEYQGVPRDGSLGMQALRYSYHFDRIDVRRFARGIHLDCSDLVIAQMALALESRDMGIYAQGGNWQNVRLHVDSIGASRGAVAKTAIGVAFGLFEDGTVHITGSMAPTQGQYLVAAGITPSAMYSTNDAPDGTPQTYAYKENEVVIDGLIATIQPVGSLDLDAYLRLDSIDNSQFHLLAPQRRGPWSAWDAANKRRPLEALAPLQCVSQGRVGSNVNVSVQKHRDAPRVTSQPTAGWPGANFELV